MEVTKDISGVDTRKRIANAVYTYMVLNVDRSKWLSVQQRSLYSAMLEFFASGNKPSRGWIASLNVPLVLVRYRYTYITRIKKTNWMKSSGKAFVFPPVLLDMAKAMVKKEVVDYHMKL